MRADAWITDSLCQLYLARVAVRRIDRRRATCVADAWAWYAMKAVGAGLVATARHALDLAVRQADAGFPDALSERVFHRRCEWVRAVLEAAR